MFSRVLYLILGIICYLSSMPSGMAKETISREARADFFALSEASERTNGETISQGKDFPNTLSDREVPPIGDALLPQSTPVSPASDPSSENESKQKQQQKKNAKRFEGRKVKTRLSPQRATKGIPRNPLTQDALQERTAMIRFLHLAAAID